MRFPRRHPGPTPGGIETLAESRIAEVEPMEKNRSSRLGGPGTSRRGILGAVMIVPLVTLAGCADLLGPSCDDCGPNPHREHTCLGWIAPVCGTYCVSTTADGGIRLLDDCCCGGDGATLRSDRANGEVTWRPLRFRAVDGTRPSVRR